MPFSKWNLEPVYVSRTPPWHVAHHHYHHPHGSGGAGGTVAVPLKGPTSVLPNGNVPNNRTGSKSTTTTTTSISGANTVSLPPFVLPLPPVPGSTVALTSTVNTITSTTQAITSSASAASSSPTTTTTTVNNSPGVPQKSSTESSSSSKPQPLPDLVNITNSGESPIELATLSSQSGLPVITVQQQSRPGSIPNSATNNEPVLIKIQCRTMVSVIRQMAALLGASDQLFAELTEDCRRLLDRTSQLRARVVKLSGTVDRANVAIRQNPPQIISLIEEMPVWDDCFALNGGGGRRHSCKQQWKSTQTVESCLFRPDTRPQSVQNLYGRAHAPGDLRLSSSAYSGVGYPSPFVTMLRLRHPARAQYSRKSESNFDQLHHNHHHAHHPHARHCACHCGRCHRGSSEPIKSNQAIQCESNRNSSPSSLVTWSSVASSTFESSAAPGESVKIRPKLKRRNKGVLSSFSSADYDEDDDEEDPTTDPKTKIDDFFRKNNVAVHTATTNNENTRAGKTASSISKCTCSCADSSAAGGGPARPRLTSDDATSFTDMYSQVDSQITATTNTTDGTGQSNSELNNYDHASAQRAYGLRRELIGGPGSEHYWQWWLSDDEHRRWSSALTSPLKPANMDEMSIWMRENIETNRRPEDVVFKSASDMPNHVMLERALSPPCSLHSIQLRPKKVEQDEGTDGGGSNTLPRLKRRWSLFPIRKRKRHQSTSAVVSTDAPAAVKPSNDASSTASSTQQFFNRFSRNRRSLPPESRLRATTDEQPEQDSSSSQPQEVVLMSPEERVKLLAAQFNAPTVVTIDVSGSNFNRMTLQRRSLIHSDFHIPRHRIPGLRSRSKSPVKGRYREDVVSPYALSGKLVDGSQRAQKARRPVAERGCQTEGDETTVEIKRNVSGRCQVAVEVHHQAPSSLSDQYCSIHEDMLYHHRGHKSHHLHDDVAYDEDDDDYVMLTRKMPNHHQRRSQSVGAASGGYNNTYQRYNRKSTRMDDLCTTFSNASTSDWQGGPNGASAVAQTDVQVNGRVNGQMDSHSNQTITLRYRNYDPAAKNRRQNGGRSSSGNWSAATSDLIQSSSTSSSPLHISSMKSQQPHLNEPSDIKTPKQKFSLKSLAHQEPLKNVDLQATNSANEEAESVYSVDNDGYYTSMHTDSGLFFGHTAQPIDVQKMTAVAAGARINGKRTGLLDGAKSTKMRFERIQEEVSSAGGTLRVSASNLVESQAQFGGSNLSINSILSNSDATSVAIDDGHELVMTPLETMYDTASSMADFDCSVSHCSHQFTNGHGHGHGHRGVGAGVGHRLQELEEKRRMTAAAIRMMQQHHHHRRVRTVSGTYDDDDDDDETLRTSSSETLHTIDDDGTTTNGGGSSVHFGGSDHRRSSVRSKKLSASYRNYGLSYNDSKRSATLDLPRSRHNQQQNQQLTHSNSLRRQFSSLTESSSASSSCRKMPPPPPPPRVSSMLQTLQKYRSDGDHHHRAQAKGQPLESDLDDDLGSVVSESVRTSLGGDKTESIASSLAYPYRYAHHRSAMSECESNSEYLRGQNERRRRLFLDVVDSTRSYPPLSYISGIDGQTDTATSVSMSSSAFFEDEFELLANAGGAAAPKTASSIASSSTCDRVKSEDTLCGGQSSATPTAASSRTVTPVPGEYEQASRPNFSTLERKQLEDRHLSSPLPPPKLASFVRSIKDTKDSKQQSEQHSPSRSSKGSPPKEQTQPSPPKPKPRNSLHFTTPPNLESFSTQTDQRQQSPQYVQPSKERSVPKSPATSHKSVTIATTPQASPKTPTKTSSSSSVSPDSAQSSSSPKSSTQNTSPTNNTTNSRRQLTTEDLFIILHNSKKKHNIRAEPEIFHSSRSGQGSGSNSSTSPRTPPKTNSPAQSLPSPTAVKPAQQQQQQQQQQSQSAQPQQLSPQVQSNSLKRRSWTGNDAQLGGTSPKSPVGANGQIGTSNQPRTRQSLALDRLGPLRPTTLTDFKRLLSQVRPSSNATTTATNGGVTSPLSSPVSSPSTTGTPVSSTYSALQQLLKGSQASNSIPQTISTSSGISSMLSPGSTKGASSPASSNNTSPLTSPLSPLSPVSSTVSSPSRRIHTPVTPSPILSPLSPSQPNSSVLNHHHHNNNNHTNASMNNFIKKFSKSKFFSSNNNSLGIDRNRSAVARLEVACPPIPEDPDCSGDSSSNAESSSTTTTTFPVTSHVGAAITTKYNSTGDIKRKAASPTAAAAAAIKHNCTSTWV